MAEKPPLPDEIRAVLDRCVGEIKERMVRELEGAETEAERLEVLARFSREIGDVRGKVSGRAGISIGQRWALIGAGLAVFGGGAATASLWPRPQAVGTTAVEAPKGDDVAVGAGEPVPVRAPVVDPPAISTPVEAARETSAIEDYAEVVRRATTDKATENRMLHIARVKFIKDYLHADASARPEIVERLGALGVFIELLRELESRQLNEDILKKLEVLGISQDNIKIESTEITPAVPQVPRPDASQLPVTVPKKEPDDGTTSRATGKTIKIRLGQ